MRFAQITDVHLFDAGYKCSGSFVEREYQENLNALRWSIGEINRHWNSGEKINFVVFTGDLGIVNLSGGPTGRAAPDPTLKCSQTSDPPGSYGPIAQMDFTTAETLLANIFGNLPRGIPVYFLPGNNDLTDEDPGTISRYDRFVAELRTLTHGRVVDLNNQSSTEQGYTLVGLNSAGFKPQTYTDSAFPGTTVNEAALVRTSTVPASADGKMFYCEELSDNDTGSRAAQKAKVIQTFASAVSGPGPYLVFTHEPDLQDPYRNLDKTPATGGSCVYRSTWLLTTSARTQWLASGLKNPKVLAIFAGHFHAADLSKYGGPQTDGAVAAIDKAANGGSAAGVAFGPQFVAPPLAIKLQWPVSPNTARGMMFVSLDNAHVTAQVDPYWSSLAPDCCGASSGVF
ncbi:MAG: metallophosphoesterase, partial [Candidatus Eremiobacteraeota bacterium]|nr:metallophosphoesterase [Candidatus Eremiobacteraeota bacterium]